MLSQGPWLLWTLSLLVPQEPQDPASPPHEIKGLGTLGLPGALRQRFTQNETVCLLIHPRWSVRTETFEALTGSVFHLPEERVDDPRILAFTPEQANQLIRDESDYPAVRVDLKNVAESFVRVVFDKLPKFEFSLGTLVSDTSLSSAPLVVFDPVFRVRRTPEGDVVETWLTVRLFHMDVVKGTAQGNDVPMVARCELLYEDRALGRAPLRTGALDVSLRASLVDALRGKIAVSFVLHGSMKGNLTVRRPHLLGDSIGRQTVEGGR